MFHVVVFEPEIPPNTGNLIRLAANTGCELHLVKPLGFRLDRKSVRRAGLDYDELATVHVHENFAAARAALPGNWFAIETGAARRHVDARFAPGDVLLFGSERRGLLLRQRPELLLYRRQQLVELFVFEACFVLTPRIVERLTCEIELAVLMLRTGTIA